ncbi:MAG: carbohydrate kinase family protein [Flavobacteriaceae bacterium]
MKVFDVLVVGELNVDLILNKIQGFPEIGKEIVSEELNITLGSSSAIFASNLSALGTKVAFLGKIGNDSFSKLVKTSLENKKVDTGFIISSDHYKTGLTVVMNYGMDRANVTFPGAMEYLTEKDISDTVLSQAKHLHLSSIFFQTGLKKDVSKLFKRAKKLGLTTSMDPQWDPAEKWDLNILELLPYVDIFLPNAQEFKYITNSTNLRSGLEKIKSFAKTIVIKNGENGAQLWHQESLLTKPAFLNKNVTDCIGAGDSFDAGFISEFLKGKNLERCLEVGNIMGAINTTASGGTTAFENIRSIKEIAATKFLFDL